MRQQHDIEEGVSRRTPPDSYRQNLTLFVRKRALRVYLTCTLGAAIT